MFPEWLPVRLENPDLWSCFADAVADGIDGFCVVWTTPIAALSHNGKHKLIFTQS
jgi:hypothetical protein